MKIDEVELYRAEEVGSMFGDKNGFRLSFISDDSS